MQCPFNAENEHKNINGENLIDRGRDNMYSMSPATPIRIEK